MSARIGDRRGGRRRRRDVDVALSDEAGFARPATASDRSCRGRVRPGVAVLGALVAIVVLACGGDSGRGASDGAVFEQAGCGTCHALQAAGSQGAVGPDLDKLRPTAELVERQVAQGGDGMPAFGDQLTPEQIRAVAEYILDATHQEEPS